MNIAPKPPLARQGQKLASHGRYGDTELVHMNPYEVQGLAAMSPTGQLTKNPVTGQPEAFLPFITAAVAKFAPAILTKIGLPKLALAAKAAPGVTSAITSSAASLASGNNFREAVEDGIIAFAGSKIFSAGAKALDGGTQDALKQVAIDEQTLANAQKNLVAANQDIIGIGDSYQNITPQQLAFDQASQGLTASQGALQKAISDIPLSTQFRSFTQPEGLAAMGRAAIQPDNLLALGTGLGAKAQRLNQEDMQRRADEAAAEDSAYRQSFTNVLTDSLGMARGSNPNPYASQYIGYANGGVIGMDTGGEFDNYDDNRSAVDIAGLQGPFVTGRLQDDGTLGPNLTYEQVIAASPQRQEEGRYFVTPRPGSAGERQAFLRGGFKQDPPTDYRHGFEEEYKFFDFIGDRDLNRNLDLFGSGPSDYLAGLLAATPERLEELGTPVAEGTLPLAAYTTTRGQQFSGVDNFSDMGVPTFDPIVNQPPTATPLPPPVVDPIVTVDPEPEPEQPPSDPTYMDAIRGLGIELDQDYVRQEGRQVFDVLEDFGVSGDEVVEDLADYFGVTEDYVEDNLDVIAQNRATKEILDKAIEGGIEQVDPGEVAVDAYTEGEKDAVFGLLQDGTLSIPAAAEYFQLPVSEVTAVYESMLAENEQEQAVAELALESANEQLRAIERSQDALDAAESQGLILPASGGRMPKKRFMTSSGMVELANGGLAEAIPDMPAETMMVEESVSVEESPDINYDELVAMTVEAILGNIENADEVIEMFIAEYGVEKFRELREVVLQSVVPNSRTEGMIQGSSGGMDDEVMGMIGDDQAVAVSPGEYIVAADVVSGLGDGNSDAGADVLDEMMESVRAARTGGRQPDPINKMAVMPA